MLTHAIIGIDFSPSWDTASQMLPGLLPILGVTHLTLVHSVETQRSQNRDAKLRDLAEERLAAMAEQLSGELGISVDCKVKTGLPATKLAEAAQQLDVDLLIVCNRSHSRAGEFFLGNVALNLARITARPLLILPADGTPSNADQPLLLASDGSDAARGAERIFVALATAERQGVVVMAGPEDSAASVRGHQARIEERIADKPNLALQILEGYPEDEIVRFATSIAAVLIVLGKRGHNSLPEMPLGAVAETVCRTATQPVLLVPRHIKPE